MLKLSYFYNHSQIFYFRILQDKKRRHKCQSVILYIYFFFYCILIYSISRHLFSFLRHFYWELIGALWKLQRSTAMPFFRKFSTIVIGWKEKHLKQIRKSTINYWAKYNQMWASTAVCWALTTDQAVAWVRFFIHDPTHSWCNPVRWL